MSKHTPGPWVADDNEGFSMWKIYSRMSPSGSGIPGPFVAEVIGDSAEADANASLIAAAPEMLDALKHCYDLLGRYEINRIDGDEIADEAASIIRSVITKATGEVLPW